MSYFDDASLVMIPSGYKTSKVYSVKPTDGTGDLTFTRSLDTATRVGPDGLIEKVRTNLATYSNAFSDGSWAKVTDGTFTLATESITDAFGNTSAVFKVTLLTGSFLVFRKTLASATTQPTNFSLYVKKTISSTYVGIDIDDNTDVLSGANTNWQRISNTRATASFVDITTYSVGEPFYIFASQVELGDIATPYIPTTTAAVSVGMLANVPRLDYLGGGCPKLILEPQRVNLITFSEQINNAAWITNGAVTITANTTISPDGFQNADSIIATGAFNGVFRTIGVANATQHTFSLYVKNISLATSINIGVSTNPSGATINFNAVTGVIASVGAAITASSVSDAGNGWYRISATYTTTGTSNDFIIFATGAMSFCVYGCQLEAGAYATSYIPTLGAAVTRSADAASKTGISALIGQTEGTLFVEEYYDASVANFGGFDDTLVATNDGTTDNLISIFHYGLGGGASNKVLFFIRAGAVTQVAIFSDALTTGTYKIALAYKNNDVVAYINGVQIGTDAIATIPATSVVKLVDPITTNAATKTVNTKQVLLFKTRLSNSDLAALTS